MSLAGRSPGFAATCAWRGELAWREFFGHVLVAGVGTDAAPYFRIFNPTLQARKFDPHGTYVRRWVPELAHLPDELIHEPWRSPEAPKDYPPPILDHAEARARTLARYRSV